MVLTKRSAWAFRFGEWGGSFADCTPLAARVSRNSAVNNGPAPDPPSACQRRSRLHPARPASKRSKRILTRFVQ